MAEAINDVANIVKVSIEGIDVIVKLTGTSLKSLAKVFEFFKNMLDFEKANGRTSMSKLLKKGGDLQVMSLKKEDLKQIKKQLKKYGVLYSEIPDYKKDGTVDLIFHTESLPRVNRIFEKVIKDKEAASIKSFDEFVKESDGKNLDLLQKELVKEKKKAEHSDITETERKNWDELLDKVADYAYGKQEAHENISIETMKEDLSMDQAQTQDCVDRLTEFGVLKKKEQDDGYEIMMPKEDFQKKMNMFRSFAEKTGEMERAAREDTRPIFVAASLIKEEHEKALVTRIPGTYGDTERRVAFSKDDIFPRHETQSFCIYIDLKKDYDLIDASGKKVKTVKGAALAENYSHLNQKMQEILRDEKKKKTLKPAASKGLDEDISLMSGKKR